MLLMQDLQRILNRYRITMHPNQQAATNQLDLQARGVNEMEQPNPTFDPTKPAIWDIVIEDMRLRDRVGRVRYGTPLQPNNGRDTLRDAYEEGLDLVVYLRQAIWERDKLAMETISKAVRDGF